MNLTALVAVLLAALTLASAQITGVHSKQIVGGPVTYDVLQPTSGS